MTSLATAVVAELRAVDLRRGRRDVLRGVDLQVRAGEVLAVAGPNGAGKSSLLGVLAGDLRPDRGDALVDRRPTTAWRPVELARRRAVLLQSPGVAFGFPARDVVAMGRAPWAGTPAAADDDARIEAALVDAGAAELADRAVTELSGGEQARVHLARTLAQDTPLVLLDEPTAALDLRHAAAALQTARALATRGRAVVVVVHDLNLASGYGDRVALLGAGRLVACGPPHEVLTSALLSQTYETPVDVVPHPVTGLPLVLPRG